MQRVILVGGGLANSLIALRLAERDDVDLLMLERADRIAGDHVWSFHDADLSAAQRAWIEPWVEQSWSGYEVRFPDLRRRLAGGYRSITSERLRNSVEERLGGNLRTGVDVRTLEPDGVYLDEGTRLVADAVIDGRGAASSGHLRIAAQKFVGQWLETTQPHGLDLPVLMDATVDQPDGYRFLYTLPFSPTLIHVEDTLYDANADLDLASMRRGIEAYAKTQGWDVRNVVREEQGALPIVLGGDIEAFWDEGPAGVPRSGLRAALFHPTTGYSLPEAVRLADELASRPLLDSAGLYAWIRQRSVAKWKADGFYRLLNRMLFQAALPGRRHLVLQRFYGLSEPLIERFYAGRSTTADRVRVLVGRPPVPLRRALGCIADPASSSPRTTDRGVPR